MAVNILDGARRPAGYFADASIATATKLTVPENARIAIIQAITADVYWTDDGTTPVDTTTGMLLSAGDSFLYTGNLFDFECISATGEVRVSFYK